MQEEDALANAPQWSRAELIRPGGALKDAIGQVCAHVMNGKIRVRMIGHVGHPGVRRRGSSERRRVAKIATHAVKQSLAILLGRCERSGRLRRRG